MADLIDRAALVEWLKKVGRFMKCCENTKRMRETIGGIISHIENLPAVDAVEVVRCEKCCWYQEEDGGICVNPKCTKSYYGCRVPPQHFCSYGERREDDEVS